MSFRAAVFTRDIDRTLWCYQHLDDSTGMVNDHTAFRIDGKPFADLRELGLAVGMPRTLEDM